MRLTEPQRRALLWLTPGQWCEADRSVSAALNSLALYHPDLAKSEWRKTPRGRNFLGYWITEAGQRFRRELPA